MIYHTHPLSSGITSLLHDGVVAEIRLRLKAVHINVPTYIKGFSSHINILHTHNTMEGFKADENWVNHFDPRSPTDDQVASLNIASLDHSIFSDRTTLADTTHSQNYANSSIDEIMTASQNAYSSPIIDQDMSYNLGTESRLALQSYSFVEEESNGELKKEVEELKNMCVILSIFSYTC